jgi:hypothetical protein
MLPTVLILSCAQDLHAHAISEAIERKGGISRILYTPDFLERLGAFDPPFACGHEVAAP